MLNQYYAVKARRRGRDLTYNVYSGDAVLATSPHNAALSLGLGPADTMAVWFIRDGLEGRDALDKAAAICQHVPPYSAYIAVETGLVLRLHTEPFIDVTPEERRAEADG